MASKVRAAVPALAAAALLVAGCGDSKPLRHTVTSQVKVEPVATPAPDDAAQLQKLLDARAESIQRGDAVALQRTSTGAAQQRRDRLEAAAAKPLPLSGLKLSARTTDVTGNRAVVGVLTTYAFKGIDTPYYKRSRVTAVRTAAGWRVVSEQARGVEAPWEVGRYTPRYSPHFVALAPRGLNVGSLMTDLEEGRAEMRRALPGVAPPARLLVLVSRGTGETRALTRDVRTLGSLTALAEARLGYYGPALRVNRISGQRVLVLWRQYGQRSTKERRLVIAHELTHAALARRTGGRVPPWLVEGIAMYASHDQRAAEAGALLSGAVLEDTSQQRAAKRALSLTALARPNALERLKPIPLSVAYSYASAAAYAIAAKHGRAGLLRLYDAFDDQSIRGRLGGRLEDGVMRMALHESLSQVQGETDAFARAHAAR
jgi:hypothetical protein